LDDGFLELLGLLTLAFGEFGVPLVGVLDVGVWGSFELRVVIVNCILDFPKEVWVTKTFAILMDCPFNRYKLIMGFSSCLLLNMWPKCCD
jgi:hypothetical protein